MTWIIQNFQNSRIPRGCQKFDIVSYHKIFENKKPQMNADERRFMITYSRFRIFNTKGFYTPNSPKYLSAFRMKNKFMAEGIITPITSEGTITIPRELMEKFNLKDRVEIVETHCSQGILIKALIES